jgi:hypothetical protein
VPVLPNIKLYIPTRSVIGSIILLVGGFIGLMVWFKYVNFYNLHFYDHGPLVVLYNVFRVLVVCWLAWITYATGMAVLVAAVPARTLRQFSLAERAVFGFGAGFGLCQVLLLTLGFLNLLHGAGLPDREHFVIQAAVSCDGGPERVACAGAANP